MPRMSKGAKMKQFKKLKFKKLIIYAYPLTRGTPFNSYIIDGKAFYYDHIIKTLVRAKQLDKLKEVQE